MAAKKYQFQLPEAEREFLHKFTSTGSRKARQIKRAHILLLSDESSTNAPKTDEQIAQALEGVMHFYPKKISILGRLPVFHWARNY